MSKKIIDRKDRKGRVYELSDEVLLAHCKQCKKFQKETGMVAMCEGCAYYKYSDVSEEDNEYDSIR